MAYSKEIKEKVVKQYKAGSTITELSKSYGITYATISRWLKRPACTPNSARVAKKPPDEIIAIIDSIYGNGRFIVSGIKGTKRMANVCCTVCGTTFKRKPISLMNTNLNEPCPTCRLNKNKELFIKSAIKYYKDSLEINVDDYVSTSSYIACRCLSCNSTFQKKAAVLMYHHVNEPCPTCRFTKSKELFIEGITKYYRDSLEVNVDDYVSQKSNINCKCTTCNTAFSLKASNLMRGLTNCPTCRLNKGKKLFIEGITKYYRGSLEISIDDYASQNSNINCKCTTCDTAFSSKASNLMRGLTSCPQCRLSAGMLMITNLLKVNNIDYELEVSFPKCKYKHLLHFDIFIPTLNVLIEFQGEQHFKFIKHLHKTKARFEKAQRRDQIKRDFVASQPHLKLIEVRYDELGSITDGTLLKQICNS